MVLPVLRSDANTSGLRPTSWGARIYFGSPLPAYVLAFLLASVGAAISLEHRGLAYPFIAFYAAAAVAAYFGGTGPGLSVIPVGALYASLFYLDAPPARNWLAFLVLGPALAVAVAHQRLLLDRDRERARELVNFKLVGDHAIDWLLLVDEALTVRYVNLRASTDLGWSDAALTGRSLASLLTDGQHQTLRSAIGNGKPAELTFQRRDRSLVQMEIGCTSVNTAEGKVIHIAARDVRERKEIARKLEELRNWESLRTLSGGLAHDFNNLLTAILGNASLASHTLKGQHEAKPMLDSIVRSAQRSAELVQLMLATSGYRPPVREVLDVKKLLDSALNNRQLPAGIHIAKDVEDASLRGDRGTFETLLWSLISNAAEAYGGQDGEVRVEIHSSRAPASNPAASAAIFEEGDAGAGECLGIVVEDHGAGMPKEVLEHAFEPFYTTKFAGRGLGLAAVRGIVRAYSGKLFLATVLGQGTRVEVWLPRD